MRWRLWCLALAMIAVAAGCDGSSTDPTVPPTPAPPAPSASAAPSATPASPAPGLSVALPLVSYGRQGGIGGNDDRLTVAPDGTYEITRRGVRPARGTLPAADFAGLRGTLERSAFADIPSVNSGGVMADGFTYYVEYGGHTVVAEDGGVPDALRPVLGALDRIFNRYG
jgi:hypothetical protein